MALPSYTVWFRGLPACPCLAKWLPAYEAELQRRGILTGPLRIYQLIGSASASADTHSKGGAFDITDMGSTEDVFVARQMGADATWERTVPPFTTRHIHGVLRGCPHNGPARYQITAVDDNYNGLGYLGRGARDDGPRPLSGRTWREGIAWAQEQGDDMFEAEDSKRLERVEDTLNKLAAAEKRRNQANIERFQRVVKKVTGVDVDLARIEKALAEELQ